MHRKSELLLLVFKMKKSFEFQHCTTQLSSLPSMHSTLIGKYANHRSSWVEKIAEAGYNRTAMTDMAMRGKLKRSSSCRRTKPCLVDLQLMECGANTIMFVRSIILKWVTSPYPSMPTI